MYGFILLTHGFLQLEDMPFRNRPPKASKIV